MKVETRDEAFNKGKKKYFTGKPCIHNHINAMRYVASGQCEECVKERSKRYYNSPNARQVTLHLKVNREHAEALTNYCKLLNDIPAPVTFPKK